MNIQLKRCLAVVLIVLMIIALCCWFDDSDKKIRMAFADRFVSATKEHSNNSSWINNFREHELKVYSQNGEDGVLLWIFTNIGTVNSPPYFVEFGVENGEQCNTRFLRQHFGWHGLMMDGSNENININLHRERITPKNINDLLSKYHTPAWIDLLSIDVE